MKQQPRKTALGDVYVKQIKAAAPLYYSISDLCASPTNYPHV